jgi:peptide/nickel transport system ATP-binding protein
MTGETPILEVRGLTKYFSVGGFFAKKRLRALNDVSFTLRRAEILAVVGESGSGKSTIARIIARLIQPSNGAVLLSGKNVFESEPRRASLEYRRRVQMIFQDPFGSLNPVHTLAHHLERPLILHGKAGKNGELTKKVYELLESVGLTPPAEFAAKHPHETSGGQRQRVAVARALAVDPDVILADEPVSMLDVSIRAGVLNLMERLKNERNVAFLYITHDIASARYVADRTLVMYAGHVVESAPSEQLVENPAHPYTKQLLAAVPDPSRASASAPNAKGRAGSPALVDPPPGCPFAERCPDVMSVCKTEMPQAIELRKGHSVRCHLHTASSTA